MHYQKNKNLAITFKKNNNIFKKKKIVIKSASIIISQVILEKTTPKSKRSFNNQTYIFITTFNNITEIEINHTSAEKI